MEVVANNYLPGDQHLVDKIVYELKSQGVFDQFRKECFADVDTKPAYQNLRQRVEGSVAGFLKDQSWRPDMNKNQVREMLRKTLNESGFLETGVERIVDQVVNPKINSVFLPKVEEIVYSYLGIKKPSKTEIKQADDLLPTDLEAVSPESESFEKKDDKSHDTLPDVDENKVEEDESPPFEPLDEKPPCIPQEENSVDSQMSGFSGMASHESNQSNENKVSQIEQESQMSRNSSDGRLSIVMSDDNSKIDVGEDSQSKSNDKRIDVGDDSQSKSSDRKVDVGEDSQSKSSDKSKVEKDKHRSSDKHKSRSDNKSDKDRDRKSSKDSKSRHSSSKDKSRDHKDSHSSGSSHKNDRSRDRDKSDRSKSSKHNSSSSKDKYKTDRSRSDKDKSSSHQGKSKDSKSKDKPSSSHKSSHSDKHRKDKDRKKDSKSKDDHYSSRDKKSDRRSTDRDSNDGHSSKTSRTTSSEPNKSSTSNKTAQDSSNSSGNSSHTDSYTKAPINVSGAISDNSEIIISSSDTQRLKLFKPKCASNMQEALKLRKIRKQLAKLEKQNQLGLASVEVKSARDLINKTPTQEELNREIVAELEVVPSPLQNTVISQDNWDAMEAKLREKISSEFKPNDEDCLDESFEEKALPKQVLKTDEPDCKYFDKVDLKQIKFLQFVNEYIQKVEKYKRCNKPKGLKRKFVDNDLKNNNNNINNQQVNPPPEKKRKGNPLITKKMILDDKFTLPLRLSENLAGKRDDSSLKQKRNSLSKASNQRYSSDDLYKPRPTFATSRRRGAKNVEN